MFEHFLDLTGSNFDARVKNAIVKGYPSITDHTRMTSVMDPTGSAPASIAQVRERSGNRFLFIWGSTWGGKRPVSG